MHHVQPMNCSWAEWGHKQGQGGCPHDVNNTGKSTRPRGQGPPATSGTLTDTVTKLEHPLLPPGIKICCNRVQNTWIPLISQNTWTFATPKVWRVSNSRCRHMIKEKLYFKGWYILGMPTCPYPLGKENGILLLAWKSLALRCKGWPSQEVERDLRLERPAPTLNTSLPLSATRPGLCS